MLLPLRVVTPSLLNIVAFVSSPVLLPLNVVTPNLANIVADVSSPVLVPYKLLPMTLPVAYTLDGRISPSATEIFGVLMASVTVTVTPSDVTPRTSVTVPNDADLSTQ